MSQDEGLRSQDEGLHDERGRGLRGQDDRGADEIDRTRV